MLNRVSIPSPNYASRSANVRLIVVHTAQGATTFRELGNFFANPNNQVSSHVGIDDTPGQIGEYVARPYAAWTQAGANPVSIAAELCAFAEWTSADWAAHPVMLDNCAQWIREEAAYYGIPLVKLTPAQAQGTARGVCGHLDLGAWGGNHWDPGYSFPWEKVLAPPPKPVPPPVPIGEPMYILSTPTKQYQVFDSGMPVLIPTPADGSGITTGLKDLPTVKASDGYANNLVAAWNRS